MKNKYLVSALFLAGFSTTQLLSMEHVSFQVRDEQASHIIDQGNSFMAIMKAHQAKKSASKGLLSVIKTHAYLLDDEEAEMDDVLPTEIEAAKEVVTISNLVKLPQIAIKTQDTSPISISTASLSPQAKVPSIRSILRYSRIGY